MEVQVQGGEGYKEQGVREVYERKVEAIDTDIYVKLKQVGEEMRRELKDTEVEVRDTKIRSVIITLQHIFLKIAFILMLCVFSDSVDFFQCMYNFMRNIINIIILYAFIKYTHHKATFMKSFLIGQDLRVLQMHGMTERMVKRAVRRLLLARIYHELYL